MEDHDSLQLLPSLLFNRGHIYWVRTLPASTLGDCMCFHHESIIITLWSRDSYFPHRQVGSRGGKVSCPKVLISRLWFRLGASLLAPKPPCPTFCSTSFCVLTCVCFLQPYQRFSKETVLSLFLGFLLLYCFRLGLQYGRENPWPYSGQASAKSPSDIPSYIPSNISSYFFCVLRVLSWVCMRVHATEHMDVEVSCLRITCRFQGSNTGYQTLWQVHLPAESSHWPHFGFKLFLFVHSLVRLFCCFSIQGSSA